MTLNEIKEVIRKNFDKTVEFADVPDAEQYRVSQQMRSSSGTSGYSPRRAIAPAPAPNQRPARSNNTARPTARPLPALDPSKEYLRTKWGIYEMPNPYRPQIQYGPRRDAKLIRNS